MEIKGKAHYFFEQSGTFKNEFIKLGIPAEDYDIQNNFGETDHIIDLFAEIESAYDGKKSIFDNISQDDLIVAFFPCIYFESLSMMAFSWGCTNYRKLTIPEKTDKIIQREYNRHQLYILLLKFVKVVMEKNIKMIFENPYAMQHYLKQGNFVKNPDIIDNNRMLRGDYYVKPTAYWFFNCEPTHGFTYQNDKEKRIILKSKQSKEAGLCSEERSMIHPDYARNFICDFILGKEQETSQLTLF
jgi:hypothetical protein